MATTPDDASEEVTIRRSPRLQAFVVVFGLLGLVGTAIATSLYPTDPSLGFLTLFGYFSLYGVTASVALGIIVWLILDRRSRAKTRLVRVQREEH
jgi:hypothetical protein